jgi:hypothetical protein
MLALHAEKPARANTDYVDLKFGNNASIFGDEMEGRIWRRNGGENDRKPAGENDRQRSLRARSQVLGLGCFNDMIS